MLRRIAVLIALLVAVPVAAHQQKIAISTIALNSRTERIELVHQVPVHDAEHALRFQGAKDPDIIGSAASREAFATYVTRRFRLWVDGELVTPEYVGSEIVGGNLMVYQDMPAPAGAAQFTVNSQILTDLWARQQNRVNIGGGTKVETFVFTVNTAARDFTL